MANGARVVYPSSRRAFRVLPEALAAADERELDARARAKRDAKITRAARAQLLAGYNKLTGGRHMVRAYSKKLQAAREREVRRSLGGGLPARFVCLSAAAGLRGPARSDQVRRAQKARRAPGTRTRAPLTIITLLTLSRSEAFRGLWVLPRAQRSGGRPSQRRASGAATWRTGCSGASVPPPPPRPPRPRCQIRQIRTAVAAGPPAPALPPADPSGPSAPKKSRGREALRGSGWRLCSRG